jgi:hypothetical protein
VNPWPSPGDTSVMAAEFGNPTASVLTLSCAGRRVLHMSGVDVIEVIA